MNISSCELVFRRHSIVKKLHSNESKIINSINVKDVQSVEYKTQSASKIFTALTECEHVTHKRLSLASARSTVTPWAIPVPKKSSKSTKIMCDAEVVWQAIPNPGSFVQK